MSRILLIDDDNDIVMLTARWFTKAGYEVATATSGKEALLMLKSETYDAILLDYAMPEMDGPATLEAIRSNESSKDIPVIFRTGADDKSDAIESLHPAGVVSKSDGKPVLMKAVEDVLSSGI